MSLDRVRAICLAQPLAAEKTSHGMPHFHIEKGKGFAWYWNDHHGDGVEAVVVKTSGPDEQDMLIEAEPALFHRPPYLGPSGWIAMRLDTGWLDTGRPDWERVAAKVVASWTLAASPRQRERFGR